MKNSKTNADLMFELLRMMGGNPLVERFKQEVLPRVTLSENAKRVITEEEYQTMLAQLKRELPYFLYYLQTHSSSELFAALSAKKN